MNTTLQALLRDLTASLSDLDVQQTQLRPTGRPGKWSIQQIAEHLLLTYSSTAQVLSTRIDKGTPTKADCGVHQRWQQFAVTRCGYFPSGRTAPDLVTPSDDLPPASGRELTDALGSELTQLDQLCLQASTLFGGARFASHAVLGPLNAAQWRRFHLVHGRHHVRQIKDIRKEHGL